MKYSLSILLFIALHAQSQFQFVSEKNHSFRGDSFQTTTFNLKQGRSSDTLRINEKIIIGAIIAHGILTGSGEQEFYISFSPLLDTSRVRISTNIDSAELYALYLDKKERKVLKILYKSSSKGMIWYYKK